MTHQVDKTKGNLPVMVETFDKATDEILWTRVINHNNPEHRQWLGKHCFWALRNGYGVTTVEHQFDE